MFRKLRSAACFCGLRDSLIHSGLHSSYLADLYLFIKIYSIRLSKVKCFRGQLDIVFEEVLMEPVIAEEVKMVYVLL